MRYEIAAVVGLAGSTFAALQGYAPEEPSTTPAATIPSYGQSTSAATTSQATYACNPAHDYGNGASCISTAGTLSLVSPIATASSSSSFLICNAAAIARGDCTATAAIVPSTSASVATYACNPAHDYGNGASCISTAGTLSLVYPSATNSAVPTGNVTVTEVVSSFTTYCPVPTILTHGGETYTITTATVLTITKCPGGCTVVKTTPAASATPSASVPVYSPETPTASVDIPETRTATETASVNIPEYSTSAASVPVAPYPTSNGTTSAGTSASGTGVHSPTYTGSATHVVAAGVLGAAGLLSALFL